MRKIFMAVIGAVVAFFGLFGVHVNLTVDPTNLIISFLLVGVWIFREFRVDWAEMKKGIQQTNKWSDPAFWVVAITAVALPLLSLFNITLAETTVTLVSSLLAILVPVVLGVFRKTTGD